MKKYTTLPIDSTQIATEALAYLTSQGDIEDLEHTAVAWHEVAMTQASVESTLPTLFSTLASESLTSRVVGHTAINTDLMLPSTGTHSFAIIPIDDCATAVVKTYELNSGVITPNSTYDLQDCTLVDTLPLSSSYLINENTIFSFETTGEQLADVLIVIFNEDITSRFAE